MKAKLKKTLLFATAAVCLYCLGFAVSNLDIMPEPSQFPFTFAMEQISGLFNVEFLAAFGFLLFVIFTYSLLVKKK